MILIHRISVHFLYDTRILLHYVSSIHMTHKHSDSTSSDLTQLHTLRDVDAAFSVMVVPDSCLYNNKHAAPSKSPSDMCRQCSNSAALAAGHTSRKVATLSEFAFCIWSTRLSPCAPASSSDEGWCWFRCVGAIERLWLEILSPTTELSFALPCSWGGRRNRLSVSEEEKLKSSGLSKH